MRREVKAWREQNQVGDRPAGLAAGQRARRFWLLLCLLLSLAHTGWGQEVKSPEEMKARYVLVFAVLTRWPTNAFTTPDTFVVGILGSDPCAKVLRKAPDLINKRKLVVKEFKDVQGTEQCQLLLVTEAKAGLLPELLTYLKNASVLTVVDAGKTVRTEGIINLGIEKKVDKATKEERDGYFFTVNDTAAKRVGLTLKSDLKDIARSVF